ncbi:hypothetical protein BD414DRAFT_432261 [Trametes punicea]|nr:hypothetical protein BD414DRAFT_432261 [Trametes punicea]
MASSATLLPSSVSETIVDSQRYLYGLSEMGTGGTCGLSDAYEHIAPTSDLQWSYPPQTLSHFEQELANDYLATQLMYATTTSAGAYHDPLQAALASAFNPAVSDLTPSGRAGASASPQSDLVDASGQWHRPSTDLAYIPDCPFAAPAAYPTIQMSAHSSSVFPQGLVASSQPSPLNCPRSSYSTIADALKDPALQEGTLPTHIDPAFLRLNTSCATPMVVSGSEGTPSPAHGSPTRPNTCTRASSSTSSRDSSPQTVTRAISRRNAPISSVSPVPSSVSNPWKCPYCPYVQRSRRSPDLKRHIKTHMPSNSEDEAEWICCGVPLKDAQAFGVPPEVIGEEPFVYGGQAMVGGCGKVFSRRDALKRHLRARAGLCHGDALAPYLHGNKVGAR